MNTGPVKTCLDCKEDVPQEFDLCNHCGFLFPKSFWQLHKNTIATTALATSTVFFGTILLFRPPATVQPVSPPTPVSTGAPVGTPTITPQVKSETPKPQVADTPLSPKQAKALDEIKTASTPAIDKRIKGNRNSRIYHWPGCPNYDDISHRNTVWFASEEEAEKAGYRAARNC